MTGVSGAVKYVVRAKGEEKPLLSSAEEGDEFDLRAQLPVLAFKHVIPSMKKGEKVKLVIQPNCKAPKFSTGFRIRIWG